MRQRDTLGADRPGFDLSWAFSTTPIMAQDAVISCALDTAGQRLKELDVLMRFIGVTIVSQTPFDVRPPNPHEGGNRRLGRVADVAFPDPRHHLQRVVQPDDFPTDSAIRVLFPS
jgi:hypothetical protein